MSSQAELEQFWTRTVSLGSKITGGLSGAVATYLTGDPFVGAAISPVLAHNLERVGNEMIARRLAPRQDVRVGRAILVAASLARERIEHGAMPRSDSFFDIDETGQAPSDEITEAVLQAAMNASQERKVDYIAALLTNIAFDQSIDVSTAHLLIETAEAISYRGMVLVKVMHETDDLNFANRGANASSPTADLYPLMSEVYGMARRGICELKDNSASQTTYALLGVDEIDPSKLYLTPLGQLLFDNLDLQKMPSSEPVYVDTVDAFRKLSSFGSSRTTLDGGTF